MKYQTTKLRESLPNVDFTYLDGPVAATGPAEPGVEEFWKGDSFYQWWDAVAKDSKAIRDSPTSTSFSERLEYIRADTTLEHITNLISEQGPFDLLVGFSHGANFITMLTAHYELLVQGDMSKVPYKAVLLICGGANGPDQMSFDPLRDGMLSFAAESKPTVLATPSIHVIGEQDSIAAASHALTKAYDSGSCSVIVHTGGHDFPKPVNKALARRKKKQGGNGPPIVDYYAKIVEIVDQVMAVDCTASTTSFGTAAAADRCLAELIAAGSGYVQVKHKLQASMMRPVSSAEKAWVTKCIISASAA